MKFAVEAAFGLLADVLPCPDPWGLGMTFYVHRYGSKRHKVFHRTRLNRDPLQRRAMAKLLKAEIDDAKKRAEPKPVDQTLIDVGAPAELTKEQAQDAFYTRWQGALGEAMADALEKGEIDLFAGDSIDQARDEVLALLDRWEGVTDEQGVPVPFTPANVAALLAVEAAVQEGKKFAGESLGDALVLHLQEFAAAHGIARQQLLEGAEKNSEGSGAGEANV